MNARQLAALVEKQAEITDAFRKQVSDFLIKQDYMISWRNTLLLSSKTALAFRDAKIRELSDQAEALEETLQEGNETIRMLTHRVDGMRETIDSLHRRTVIQEREIEALKTNLAREKRIYDFDNPLMEEQ